MTHKFFSSLIFFVVLFIAVSSQSFATPKASFLLANAKTGDIVIQEGDVSSRTSPWCSFNIALALIGFETGVLENAEVPEWSFSGDDNSLPFDMWKGKKTPKTWMKYSVVWYSQILAQSVGMEKFKDFLINKTTDQEKIALEAIIRPNYWAEKKIQNPEIVAQMKKYVRELDL